MSKGIDYSKWDAMDYGSSSSSSEGDGDEEEVLEVDGELVDDDGSHPHGNDNTPSSAGKPRVTKLDGPSKITRTADGSLIVEAHAMAKDDDIMVADCVVAAPILAEVVASHPETAATAADSHHHDNNEASPTSDYPVPAGWTEKGSTETVQGCQVYWSQDRYSVTIRIILPSATGKWTCHINNLLSFDDRYVAIGSAPKAQLEIRRADETKEPWFQGEIAYPAHAAEDEQGVDWSIEEALGDRKVMLITLYKATPMPGMAIWWKRPFAEMAEIAMEWRDQASTGFQQAWKEAHEQFKDTHRS